MLPNIIVNKEGSSLSVAPGGISTNCPNLIADGSRSGGDVAQFAQCFSIARIQAFSSSGLSRNVTGNSSAPLPIAHSRQGATASSLMGKPSKTINARENSKCELNLKPISLGS